MDREDLGKKEKKKHIIRGRAAFTLKTQRAENREKWGEGEGDGKGLEQRAGLWETELNEYFSSIFFLLSSQLQYSETPAYTV